MKKFNAIISDITLYYTSVGNIKKIYKDKNIYPNMEI